MHRGEVVVDTWGGWADKDAGRPWAQDTLGIAWSTTKGMASLAVHLLADRGALSLEQPVAEYWPEYAAEGKERTLVRHVLAMEAGLFDVRHLVPDARSLLDWEEMTTRLAAARPAHVPGGACGYHALTYGHLAGELVRRVAGQSLGAFLEREVRWPLDLDGLFVGTPRNEHPRVAPVPRMGEVGPRAVAVAKGLNRVTRRRPLRVDLAALGGAGAPNGFGVANTPEFLTAEVPSVNGTFTARSLAAVYANLAAPDDAPDRLLSADHVRLLGLEQNSGRDLVLPMQPRWRLGYHQPFPREAMSHRAFGFYGAFGSGAWADPTRELAIGFVLAEGRTPVSPINRIGTEVLAIVDSDGPAAGR
jgi:CubicO group peptidase (beta-lactamase class C family)